MPDNPTIIPYGRQNKTWYLNRRLQIIVVVALILGAGVIALKPIVAPHIAQRQFLSLQQRMAQPVLPDGAVFYTEDESLIAQLRGKTGYRSDPIGHGDHLPNNWHLPASWPMPLTFFNQDAIDTTIGGQMLSSGYRGIRRTPRGQDRLITTGANVWARSNTERIVSISQESIDLANSTPGSRGTSLAHTSRGILLSPSDRLTLFAGRSDPNDANRFTMNYKLNGQDGVIDFRLRDDGVVVMNIQSGSAIKAPRWWTYPDPMPPDDVDNPGGIWPRPTKSE